MIFEHFVGKPNKKENGNKDRTAFNSFVQSDEKFASNRITKFFLLVFCDREDKSWANVMEPNLAKLILILQQ